MNFVFYLESSTKILCSGICIVLSLADGSESTTPNPTPAANSSNETTIELTKLTNLYETEQTDMTTPASTTPQITHSTQLQSTEQSTLESEAAPSNSTNEKQAEPSIFEEHKAIFIGIIILILATTATIPLAL